MARQLMGWLDYNRYCGESREERDVEERLLRLALRGFVHPPKINLKPSTQKWLATLLKSIGWAINRRKE